MLSRAIFCTILMTTLLKALTFRSYGAGFLSSALCVHNFSNRAACDKLAMSSSHPVPPASSASNPLLNHKSTPLFAEITADHVLPAVESNLNKLKVDFSGLELSLKDPKKKHDYPAVVEELERVQAPLSYSWGVVGHLMGVKNSDGLRKAHDAMQPRVIEVNQHMGQSQTVYSALSALKNSDPALWEGLEEAQQRIVDSAIKQMESSGVGLPPAQREQFNKLQQEAAELSTKFSNNVLDSTKQFKLYITNSKDLAGLPASAKALAAQQAAAAATAAHKAKEDAAAAAQKALAALSELKAQHGTSQAALDAAVKTAKDASAALVTATTASAEQHGNETATAEAGPWLLTLDMPSYLPAMQHLQSSQLRETLYKAYVTRASSGAHDNAPIIQRILQIKSQLAGMLDYACHAEKSLSVKMADSVDAVMQLTEMLRAKAMPAAQKELQELKAFAKSQGHKGDLALWDLPYWSERLREKQYQFSEEELRAYFALPAVLDGMFSLANRLFGVTITAADGEAQVWHPDVRYFKIQDTATGEHIASFFLDPYSRPAEKRGGAWMDVCLGKSRVLKRVPVAYLTCNGSPPVGDKPSLMTFREVETLFHEFGHGLQHMLTTVAHGDAAGINNVEWDAVELPSQFMENWCYDRPTLFSFAKHYGTGAPLPEALFNKVKAAKNFQAGLQMIRQLYFGAMDMHLHSTKYDPAGPKTIFEVQHELASLYTVIPPLAQDRFLCSFGHIFAGGYSAGYYSYKWAEVMSADAFAAFEEAGLDNEAAVRETGRRFRDTVLALGGGKHPSEVFKLFRGREPSPEALLRHSGLSGGAVKK